MKKKNLREREREIYNCGAEGFGNPGPFHIKLLGDIAEDNPVLGEPRSSKEKATHP